MRDEESAVTSVADAVGYGVRVRVTGSRQTVDLPPGCSWQPPAGDPDGEIALEPLRWRVGDEAWIEVGDIPTPADLIEDIVAQCSTETQFFHGAVVGTERGAIVLPGGSGAGKTTLTRALLDQGCRYFSDEYCVVSPDGMITAYPRPIRLARHEQPSYRPERAAASGEPIVPATLAFVSYDGQASHGQLDELTPGEAAIEILRWSFGVRRDPARALAAAEAVAARSSVRLRGSRGEAGAFATELVRLNGLVPVDERP